MSRGSQALKTILKDTSQVALAKKTGLSQSFLSRLSSGKKPKLLEDALALESAGIPVEWWDEPPLQAKKSANRRNPSTV